MTADIPQKTQAWREARVGKITASMVGAVLGVSPHQSRRAALKRMVQESLGNLTNIGGPAIQWGNDHEEEALRLYKALYRDDVEQTGFHSKGDLGASPDGLVGDDGLVEIKCPYGLRNDQSPEFKSLDEVPHYYHQMQLQMLVLDRQWCDFLQWTPHDHKLDRVERDPNWLETHSDEITSFLEEHEALLAAATDGGPADRLVLSDHYQQAAEAFILAKAEEDAAKARTAAARDEILALVKASKLTECEGEGIRVQYYESKGTVDYKALAEKLVEKEDLETMAEEFRKPGTTSWKINVLKEKK